MYNPHEIDKEHHNDDKIATYPQGLNIAVMLFFGDKNTTDSIEKLKNKYKGFTKNY